MQNIQKNNAHDYSSEKKRVELAARNIGAGLYIIDKNYIIKWQNKLMDEMFGELKAGETCYEKYRGLDDIHRLCASDSVFNGIEFAEEKILIANDGAEKHFLLTSTPLASINEGVNEAIVLAVDITKRKEIEKALNLACELTRNILNSMKDAIAIINISDHRIIDVNNAFLEEYNLKKEEAIGRTCYEITHNREKVCELPDDICPLSDIYNNGETARVIHKHYEKDGTERYKEITVFPVKENGKIIHAVHLEKDITDIVDAEYILNIKQQELVEKHDELKQATNALEITNIQIENDKKDLQFALDEISFLFKKVAEERDFGIRFSCPEAASDYAYRIGEFFNHMMDMLELQHNEIQKAYTEIKSAQMQVLQQEKMASIGQLAAGIAHEINNPIGFVMSNIKSLQKYINKISEFMAVQSEAFNGMSANTAYNGDPVFERIKEKRWDLKIDYIMGDLKNLISESLDGAERVKRIVQNLKSFSRIDEAEYKMADLNSGMESTISIVWNELKYKSIVRKEYGDIPLTKCNLGHLNQVFMNILVNAAHAIEKQGEITVRTWNDDGNIYVSISDTGCGIPSDKINRIFEPFYTTKEVGKGTGLGLSIAYDIVKKHNGAINVESEAGVGTTFTVKIPVING